MRVVKDFVDQADKEAIVINMVSQGYTLIEEQYHLDGKHLVFVNSEPSPPPPEPPKSTHYARVTGYNIGELRPLSVVRTWNGQDFPYNCFVTQGIKDDYIAGKLAIGDFVLVHFDDCGEQIAMMKIYKTW